VKTAHESWTEGRASGSGQLRELPGVHADDHQDVTGAVAGTFWRGTNELPGPDHRPLEAAGVLYAGT